ncbi:MAG: 4-(cytidine 5'-diphospho)-2-C-methyl-D-erythritol kinase [Rhodocyclaceae bacterium]|nr:4-(cytidine 5'-diphospho)-2-C-methyl-D-erythritol kinase [Rhodocyclaceae bacterium]
MRSITAIAPAKLNLTLEVLGKRPDGYHDIRSVFLAVTLADELEFAPRGDGRIVLDCNDPHLPVDERNLVVKAALLLRDACRLPAASGAGITVRKNVPVGAGLGGGSSDAATALLALNKLWGAGASRGEIAELGAQIGSDVPFFVLARAALVTGRGEHIEPQTFPHQHHFVVVYPGFPVSTAWAYRSLRSGLTNGPEYSKILLSHCLNGEGPERLAQFFHNDFEPTVVRQHPQIAQAKGDLAAAGALGVMMSGSGSAVFGIFPDAAAAQAGLRQTRQRWPRSYACASLRDPIE